MDTEKLRDAFVQLLGEEAVLDAPEQLEPYASDYSEQDPLVPAMVLLPTSTEQVQRIVRAAGELGCTLTVRVSGSNVASLGMAPPGGVVLDLSRMNKILDVNAEDMYALVEPGVTWEQLKAHLAKLELPLRMGYPLSPPDTSIVANCILDGLGNLSMRYGAMADWIGGLEVVLPDGELCRTGAPALSEIWFGRGPLPDLTGLFVAAQGATGVVTKMAFQLWPMPPLNRRMFILMYDQKSTFQAMRGLSRLGFCDDVGGLSWPTGKMLFGVQHPEAKDPAEPEFFLYLDTSGTDETELALRLELLNNYLQRLRDDGARIEAPLDMPTLVRLNPAFAKFAEFPTRLEFLVDHPGGGLSWVGTYGPMSRFDAFGEDGCKIMERHGFPPAIVSRPMKGGHFGVMRFLCTFDKSDADMRRRVREMNVELVESGLSLGFIPYKTPPWTVEQIKDRMNPGFVKLFKQVRGLLDPKGIMSPRSWPL